MIAKVETVLLTITESGMLGYWIFAWLVAIDIIVVDPTLMYSDYSNPFVVSWNWSFLPLDILFSVLGLVGRFVTLPIEKKELLAAISLALMFCAGLMALSFWIIRGSYDPLWWLVNLWLIFLSAWKLGKKLKK